MLGCAASEQQKEQQAQDHLLSENPKIFKDLPEPKYCGEKFPWVSTIFEGSPLLALPPPSENRVCSAPTPGSKLFFFFFEEKERLFVLLQTYKKDVISNETSPLPQTLLLINHLML